MSVKEEILGIIEALKYTTNQPDKIIHGKGPRMIIRECKIVDVKDCEGIILEGRTEGNKIYGKIIVKEGYKFKDPIHMCFGITQENVEQEIYIDIILEDNSEITLMSHCSFIKGKVKHIMFGNIKVGKNAKFTYKEVHYHGKDGEILVKPDVNIEIEENGIYISEFTLTKGRIGKLEINQNIIAKDNSVIDVIVKTYATGDDIVYINENVKLVGKRAKAMLRSKGAARDKSKITLKLRIEGIGDETRGHIDCTEIIKGEAYVESIPIVVVNNETARITHEAAIGSVDKKQLETLMAKGLDEEEATELIVKGMLGED